MKTIVLAELWRRFKERGDRSAREGLVVAYAPIVRYAAGRVGARMPPHVEQADLISYGFTGLLTAIDRFEPERGIQFETFAVPRIRGAILDQLRSLDWVPRSIRDEARNVERANAELERSLGRAPDEEELAAKLDLSVPDLRACLQRVSESELLALDGPWGSSDEGLSLFETLPSPPSDDPASDAHRTEMRDQIADALERLPSREQMIVGLHYRQELTFAEIGTVIDISESRVSQLHAQALLRLRPQLHELAPS